MIGFVYLWRDRKRKMYYIGSHTGSTDDGYICSAGPRFWNAYKKRPEDFKRRVIEIIHDGDHRAVRAAESRWLQLIKPGEINVRYYNKNRIGYGFDKDVATLASSIAHLLKNEDGKSLTALKAGRGAALFYAEKDENGKSVLGVKYGLLGASLGGFAVHREKDELGRSIRGLKLAETVHAEKDGNGKSLHAIKIGKISQERKKARIASGQLTPREQAMPEKLRAALRRAYAAMTPEQLRARALKGAASMTPEQRSERSRKAAETTRQRRALKMEQSL